MSLKGDQLEILLSVLADFLLSFSPLSYQDTSGLIFSIPFYKCGSRGGTGENYKNIGFLSNTGPDPS